MGAKHSYLGISLDLSATGVCSITMPMLIADVLKGDDGKLLYLRGTPEIGLVLDGRERIALEVFADASHAVHDTDKGHSGALTRVGNASVYASSIKQKVMLTSSFEAELSSLHEVIPQMMGTRRFIAAHGYFVSAV